MANIIGEILILLKRGFFQAFFVSDTFQCSDLSDITHLKKYT